jgi:hypothetical protein
MKFRWVLKSILFLIAIPCYIVVGVMYNKLSFIDWPYLLGGVFFLATGVIIPVKKKDNFKKKR